MDGRLGVVAASVGFTFLGLGLSFVQPESSEITIGWVLMAAGAVVGLIRWLLFKRTEGPDTSVVEPGTRDLDGVRAERRRPSVVPDAGGAAATGSRPDTSRSGAILVTAARRPATGYAAGARPSLGYHRSRSSPTR